MLKRLLLFSVLGFMTAFCSAQTVVILDHEAPATTTNYTYFGHFPVPGPGANSVVPNPDPSGINTSANVGDFFKPEQAQVWAGGFPNPPHSVPVTLSGGADEICIDVYMDHIGNLALKLENSTNGGPNWISQKSNTAVNQWEQLCFPVADPSFEGPFQPAAGFDYNTVVLFFDFGVSPATSQTYYFDNLVVNTPPPPPPPAPVPSPYCATEVTHFNIPAEVASKIYLTVDNVDANTMKVEIESADADPVDFLLIVGGSGATISPEDFSVPGKISRTLTWAVPPTDVVMNILWSKASFGGNWQLVAPPNDLVIPFLATCNPPNAIPTMGEWSLFYLAMIMLILGTVYVTRFQTQMQLSMEGAAKAPVKFSLNQLPFDKAGYIKAIKIALTLVPLGFLFIYTVWGEIIFDDLIGMTLAVPLVGYFIYLLKK